MKPGWSNILSRMPLELFFWLVALLLLATADPAVHGHEHHFTLCPLANMGMEWCPGCGIGRSITHVLHGNIRESWSHHWFGLPAVVIIGYRIFQLGMLMVKKGFKNNYKEEEHV